MAKDEFFFDRFPSAVTPATAVCSQLRHVRNGLTVVEASASFDYKCHLQLHQKTSAVDITLDRYHQQKKRGARARIMSPSVFRGRAALMYTPPGPGPPVRLLVIRVDFGLCPGGFCLWE